MTEPTIFPRIDKTQDASVRAYAFIGLCISLVAEIEHKLFHCFNHTLGGDKKANAARFYRGNSLRPRVMLADKVVRGRIKSQTALSTWVGLIEDIERFCDGDSMRNLVAHHPLRRHILVRRNPDGTPHMIDNSALYAELAVQRDPNVVLAGPRPDARHTLDDFRQYAAELSGLYLRLYHFDDEYLRPFVAMDSA